MPLALAISGGTEVREPSLEEDRQLEFDVTREWLLRGVLDLQHGSPNSQFVSDSSDKNNMIQRLKKSRLLQQLVLQYKEETP